MSWSITAYGQHREEALRNLRTAAEADQNIPQSYVSDVINGAAQLSWKVPEGRPVSFTSTGHVDADESGYSFAGVSYYLAKLPLPVA